MYVKRVSFVDKEHNHDDTSERKGPSVLLDLFKLWAEPSQKRPWSEKRAFDLLVTSSSTFQATSTSVLYTIYLNCTKGVGLGYPWRRRQELLLGAFKCSVAR